MATSKQVKEKINAIPPEPVHIPELVTNEMPDLSSLSEDTIAMLALSAAGLSRRAVARRMNCDVATVQYQIDKHDPDRKIVLSKEAQTSIMLGIMRSKMYDALVRISGKGLDTLNPLQLMTFIEKATKAMKDLEPATATRDAGDLLSDLKKLAPQQ